MSVVNLLLLYILVWSFDFDKLPHFHPSPNKWYKSFPSWESNACEFSDPYILLSHIFLLYCSIRKC